MAALLRANGVPARVLAGYPTWSGPLQTHYIVEAYVPAYGWYAVESTMLQAPWPPEKQVEVAIVPPGYEDRAGVRYTAMAGVTYLSLTESPGLDGSLRVCGTIDAGKNCDHVAASFRRFGRASPADWRAALEVARARWTAWLASKPTPGARGRLATPLGESALDAETPAALARPLAASKRAGT